IHSHSNVDDGLTGEGRELNVRLLGFAWRPPFTDLLYPLNIYEKSAECPAIYGGDECGAGARGMQSPSTLFKMPRVSTRGD
ncbi:hypothetical protein KA005_63470, partial [bacterium]|nr:hypothetical protein [bacterium]